MNAAQPANLLTAGEVADILLRKYTLLKQEIFLHIGYYKGHVRNFQLIATAIFGAGAYVASNQKLFPTPDNWWAWWALTTFIPLVSNYLLFDIVETQYATILLGERLATIEEQINELAGKHLLIWESSVSPLFWQTFRPIPGVINPDWFLGALGFLISAAICVGVPAVVYHQLLWPLATSTGRQVALLLAVLFALCCNIATTICMRRVLLGMRNIPRIRMRQMLDVPLLNRATKQHKGPTT